MEEEWSKRHGAPVLPFNISASNARAWAQTLADAARPHEIYLAPTSFALRMAVALSMMESLTGIDIDGDGKADSANELPHFDPGAQRM